MHTIAWNPCRLFANLLKNARPDIPYDCLRDVRWRAGRSAAGKPEKKASSLPRSYTFS
jgi:hypothetical protein